MLDVLNGALRISLITLALCGFAYPLSVTLIAQAVMPSKANGSLVTDAKGIVVGSRLIGEQWNDPQWFHGRPSATTDTDPNDSTKTIPAPYNAANTIPPPTWARRARRCRIVSPMTAKRLTPRSPISQARPFQPMS
jgi:K+-transporting ATPase ATPase C chain